eukprot:45088-Pyramimonas_sp.AAC.1
MRDLVGRLLSSLSPLRNPARGRKKARFEIVLKLSSGRPAGLPLRGPMPLPPPRRRRRPPRVRGTPPFGRGSRPKRRDGSA